MRSEASAQRGDTPDGLLRRRKHQRVPFTGQVRLMLDTRAGLVTLSGYIMDVSLGGCALRVYQQVEAHRAGRVQLEVGGQPMWLPIVTRWSRQDSRGWSVGMEFDRPPPDKLAAVTRLIEARIR